ncbi:MAG: CocE/NonD family hydrolase [Paraclostridium bifermentans]|uniref:CocE/NonD family hydrolase n=1 Tax=Paraclostridium bifermentans TaxID=1490 RepID=UPI0011DE33FB|nr:CocE/NonD family hydrolase [Paraclostridium bifermentans]MBS6509225.1 CocE/NonD family hydrolase [Paraclostridium bifermentans]MDU3803538.1 CocE/NonD family hydrolase [Paraclostridium bifermentans]
MNKFLGNPKLKPTDFYEPKAGLNNIVMATAHYGNQEMIMEKDVPVKMKDGVTLYVNVFRPNKPGKYPVVMSADAYGKDTFSMFKKVSPPTLGAQPSSDFAVFESPDPGFWVPNDYVLVKVALRGSATSEGELHPWTMAEANDFAEVVEWAGVQEWSNGNVGTNGVSYLAVVQWKMASLNPPHLKAMIPWEGLNDVYREAAYHGGIPETNFFGEWAKGLIARWPDKVVEDMAQTQKEHPLMDEYWEKNMPNLSDIKTPMLVCAGWATVGLHNRGSFEGFKKASSRDKWLVVHGRKEWETYYSRESLELQKSFFDYYLKEIDNGWMDTPRVRYELREKFYQGQNKLTTEWPLPNTKYTELYLNGENMTLQTEQVKDEKVVSYSTENTENDEVRFKIDFKENTEITGYMKLKLWVSSEDADDMDLFVGVKKFDKNGEEVYFADYNHIENGQVSAGWVRVSHRELDKEKSTPYQPLLTHKRELKLAKGEVVPVEIEIWPTSALFKSGESLVLVVKGSEVIKENAMINRYAHLDTVNKGVHKFYTGGKYDAHLLVPVIK